MPEGDGHLNQEDFLAEAGEILEHLAEELLQAEKDLQGGPVSAPRVNTLFRHVHSLKGLSGMLAQPEVSRVTHRVEDYLDRLRMGRLSLDAASLDSLFEAVDVIERLVTGRATSPEVIDALLSGLEGKSATSTEGANGDRPAEIDGRILTALTQYEEHRLRACMEASARVLLIAVRFPLETFDDELRHLIGALNEIGEVISTLPAYAAEEGTAGLAFEILFAGAETIESLAGRLGQGAVVRDACPPQPDAPVDNTDAPAHQPENDDLDDENVPVGDGTGTVRVDLERLDRIMTSVGELIVERRKLASQARELLENSETQAAGQRMVQSAQELGKKLEDLQRSVIGARMVPVNQVVGRLTRLVRKLSRKSGKEIEFRAEGARTELDKVMIDRLLSPLMHLVRNAVDHGFEPAEERRRAGKTSQGHLVLSAAQRGNSVVLRLSDDGRGLDLERIRNVALARGILAPGETPKFDDLAEMLFHAGFSTCETVSEVSGRGVGLDVVRREILALNGRVRVDSGDGTGTTFEIELPITLAIIQSMLTRASGQVFAIPVASISETIRLSPERIASVAERPVVRLRGATLPMVSLGAHFRLTDDVALPDFVVVMRSGDRLLALGVDELLGQQEVVIKAIGRRLENIPGLAGATEIGEDDAALVVDPTSLAAELYGARGTA